MLKPELINLVADKLSIKSAEAKIVIDTYGEIIKNAILTDDEVVLPGVGKFIVSVQDSYVGRNPKTGEAVEVPAKKRLKFKPEITLRKALK